MAPYSTTQTMQQEQLKAFLKAAGADKDLQDKLKTANHTDTIVAIAKAAGFDISAESLTVPQELSDQDLEEVAGGTAGTAYYWGGRAIACLYNDTNL